ncbi:uncharacterized protein LOC121386293 [Gigantopelta aegis]|uniref:uncharacterized protein LOC121386293 n=1 Tax=Gigantopelta aegis TaxID=1735272 RepID=UPI001B88BA24|nr:uncharacterized protein LOC121386293 [Gigantopelta aegis]
MQTTKLWKKHFFDEESGLWQFESLSNHQPLEEGDPVLQAAMRHRFSLLDGLNGAQRDFEGNLWRDRSGPFSLYLPAIYGPCLCGNVEDHTLHRWTKCFACKT